MSLDDIRTRIEYVNGWSVAVIELNERMDVLSSCFLNGGLTDTSTMVIIQVEPEYFHDPFGHGLFHDRRRGLPRVHD